MMWDVIVIGSGIGGLTAGALLARDGRRVLVCESHRFPGGAAHAFSRRGFCFDSGPSFYCGLSGSPSLNPLKQVLDLLGESLATVPYAPLGHYHFPEATLPIDSNLERYRQTIAQVSPQGAQELAAFHQKLLGLYGGLQGIPAIALSSDWRLLPKLLVNYGPALLKLLPYLGLVNGSAGRIMDGTVADPWVRRLIDLECFLLSGLKAHGTIAPEVAFMLGERDRAGVEYPVGGSGAIAETLVRGLERWGGQLRTQAHVEEILVRDRRAVGVRLASGEVLQSQIVISNASIWDTYGQLLPPDVLPPAQREQALATPAIASFMHLHLGIRAEGLEGLTGHHVVVHHRDRDITEPGNTCMISIPSVWDGNLAPQGHHVVHAYSLEPFPGWQRDEHYAAKKQASAQPLYQALAKVIPDLQERVVLALIGTPLTHAHYLRRYQGTYGPAIAAEQGFFPHCHTAIANLYRVGDSTLPGIGVPAAAASGILCANTLRN